MLMDYFGSKFSKFEDIVWINVIIDYLFFGCCGYIICFEL